MQVYKAIAQVMKHMAGAGISKDRTNHQQNYKFRGIDDVFNALAPALSEHGLIVLPRVLSRECVERVTSKGSNIFYVTVEVEFDFVAAEDGSKHTVKTFGEAMDSADKATNKAMSAAYKYAALQTFCIPTEGDNDSENDKQDTSLAGLAEHQDKITACKTLEQLANVWANTPTVLQRSLTALKDKKKSELNEAKQ